MVVAPPTDRELIDVLRAQQPGLQIAGLSRRPYSYATSAPLEELSVSLKDGSDLQLIFKDLSRERLLGDALAIKPRDLHEPERELETYRMILDSAGVGPRFFAAVSTAEPLRRWLLIEKVRGIELWQVGELEIWERVASWLGEFHARFEGEVEGLRTSKVPLIEHTAGWFQDWRGRAQRSLSASGDPRAPQLTESLDQYEEVVAALARMPRTLVHGELYPSNVMVVQSESPVRVCPVDWEMAALGPGLIDLAALVGGWEKPERERLVKAYARSAEAGGAAPFPSLSADLARCRLHLALQWIGWSTEWVPPAEHANDWVDEALGLVKELSL